MTETARKQRLLLGCLALFAASASGEVFTHRNQAENFEAVVTADQLVVKERYQGATTIYGDLTCPLGPAVSAVVLPLASDGRICLQFSKDKCKYTRFQNGEPIHGEELKAPKPRMCIALASAQDAQRFAVLVNAGLQPTPAPAVGSTSSGAREAPVAGESGAASAPRNEQALPAERQPAVKPPPVPPVAKVEVAPSRPAAALPPSPPAEPEPKAQTAVPAPRQAQSAQRDEDEKKTTTASRSSSAVPASPAMPSSARSSNHTNTSAPSGTWVTESFVVGPDGSRRMTERTYASAFVGKNAPGKPPGDYLYIRNKSDKHLLFYSLGDGPQLRLEPGSQVVLALGLDRSGARGETQKSVTLLWFDAGASGGSARYR